MQDNTHKPVSARASSALFHPHWQVRKVSQGGVLYDIVDARGAVVASNVRSLELARLFASAPVIYDNFRLLEAEAVRAFFQMLDVNEGVYDVAEVADDLDGEWEERCPGAPSTAGWLKELGEIRETVGDQRFPPSGVHYQGDLFEE